MTTLRWSKIHWNGLVGGQDLEAETRDVRFLLRRRSSRWFLTWTAGGELKYRNGSSLTELKEFAQRVAEKLAKSRKNPVLITLSNPKRSRKNPALIVLSNPMDEVDAVPAPPAAWEKFHLRDRDRARMTHVDSIAGVPERVTSLGLCEGVEMVDQHGTVEFIELDPTRNDGPWLVTDDETMSRLWIVSKTPITELLACEGYRSAAIFYWPPANSSKYEAARGYRHEWGDGGKWPKAKWPEKAYPMLTQVGRSGRAYEFTDGDFTVKPEGIVG